MTGGSGGSEALSDLLELVEWIGTVVRRPPRGEATTNAGHRSDRAGLPLIYLSGNPQDGWPLPLISRYLAKGEYARARGRSAPVPHALYDYASEPPVPDATQDPDRREVEHVRHTLSKLSTALSSGISTYRGRLTFPRFALLSWLMHQNVGAAGTDPRNELFDQLRGWDAARRRPSAKRIPEALRDLAAAAGGEVGPVVALLPRLVQPLWFPLKRSGRVPGLGAEYRWLRRQPHLAPNDPGTTI